MDWYESQNHCQNLGYDGLATILDASEQDHIINLSNTVHLSDYVNRACIGYNDQLSEGDWTWSSGLQSEYSNWLLGQPDNSGGEHCGHLQTEFYNFSWGDFICEEPTTHLLCEKR